MTERHTITPPFTYVALSVAALFFFGVFALAGCTPNDPAPPPDADEDATVEVTVDDTNPIASGRASYEAYCASCHGLEGKGDGEVAADLARAPSNLTLLSSENNGAFPVDAVFQTIDGREDVEAHGPREMPVWGNIWSEDSGDPIPPEVVEQRINELVEYIRSIQE